MDAILVFMLKMYIPQIHFGIFFKILLPNDLDIR